MKISIITVCQNDRVGLENTFESLQSQDSSSLDWWVIDGNSTDGTQNWLRKNHILDGGWISEEDNGIYDAMNKGIRLAYGDYLLFLNSGDKFAGPDVISNLIAQIEREKTAPDFIYGDSLDVAESGRSSYRKALPVSYIKIGMITRHQSMLYKRERILPGGYPSEFKLSADYALTANLLMKNEIVVLQVRFPICIFSLGGKHDILRLKALQEDFEIRKKILKENPLTCILLFCVHWLHHYIRKIFPHLNRRFIYHRSTEG